VRPQGRMTNGVHLSIAKGDRVIYHPVHQGRPRSLALCLRRRRGAASAACAEKRERERKRKNTIAAKTERASERARGLSAAPALNLSP
jgi:hypothetical protein